MTQLDDEMRELFQRQPYIPTFWMNMPPTQQVGSLVALSMRVQMLEKLVLKMYLEGHGDNDSGVLGTGVDAPGDGSHPDNR